MRTHLGTLHVWFQERIWQLCFCFWWQPSYCLRWWQNFTTVMSLAQMQSCQNGFENVLLACWLHDLALLITTQKVINLSIYCALYYLYNYLLSIWVHKALWNMNGKTILVTTLNFLNFSLRSTWPSEKNFLLFILIILSQVIIYLDCMSWLIAKLLNN